MTPVHEEPLHEEPYAFPATGKVVSPKDYASNEKLKLSGRVLNVMTMLPSQIHRKGENGWTVKPVRGNSALYSSHFFLDQQTDWESHLIAWTGEMIPDQSNPNNDDPLYLQDEDKIDIESQLKKANKSENIHPVWLLRKDQSRFRNYAENVLWPVFHYIQSPPSNGQKETEAWYDYVRFNEAYAKKIKAIYKPGDIIWIHDYYLLLLPQLLRMEFPDAYICLYVHCPFPSSEYFRCLSKRTQLLDGMLGANKIGFQTPSFARHFISCCTRLLGCEATPNSVSAYGSQISIDILPIGIDTLKIEHDAFDADNGIEQKIKAIRDLYGDKKIIVGRDRLDTVRGVVQKLQAFEVFLSMYPEWINKVVLIQVSSPGYSHSAKIEKKVSELVNHINGTYGSLHSTPVQHYQMRIAKDEYLSLLRVADLALITSVRDGMNTTSLEFVLCQKENSSPIILSEFTGTASVLQDAILVNPWDAVGVAKTINETLLMSDDQKLVLEKKLYNQVKSNTIQKWTSQFLEHLIEDLKNNNEIHTTPALNRPLLLNNYKNAKRRLFLFDYDGTLTPIVSEPSAAIPSARLNSIIDSLSKDPLNQIWIISGRDQAFLDKWFGNKKVGLSAEHGCFMKDVGSPDWVNLAAEFDMSWQKEVEEVFSYYTERTPGTSIERKKVALTWHYRKADPDLGSYQAKLCYQQILNTITTKYDVEVMEGKANIEVRPKFVNKGEIVKRLVLNTHGIKQDPKPITNHRDDVPVDELPDFILCLGDDLTDEDMFRALINIETRWIEKKHPTNNYNTYGMYPVAVGPASKKTIATAHLNDPSQVIDTLGLLTGHVSIFESAGSVDLDDRGHVTNSASSERSKSAAKAYNSKRSNSKDKPNTA